LFVTTRIFVVAIPAKLIWTQTLLLPTIDPPGTVTQLAPSQYCTSKAVSP
jgi:hypothetical protein